MRTYVKNVGLHRKTNTIMYINKKIIDQVHLGLNLQLNVELISLIKFKNLEKFDEIYYERKYH
jgi:hypothetical protein